MQKILDDKNHYNYNPYNYNHNHQNKKIDGCITFMLFFIGIIVILFALTILAQFRIIPTHFSPIHSMLKDMKVETFSVEKHYSYQQKTAKEAVEDSISEDFKVAKQMGEDTIIKDVKQYNLAEGITLEEKIKLMHPTDFDKLQWEISQFPDDLALYFIKVSLDNEAKYSFNYNSVTYNVDATTADTNNLMTIPYQAPAEE